MNRRIAVRAIVIHQGKLLCVRLKPSAASPHNGTFWCLPGGGLDSEESLVDGLRREMLEETGIEPTIGSLVYIQQFKDDAREYLEFFFNVTNAEDYVMVDLSNTTHGAQEIEEIDFVDPRTENVLPTFLTKAPLQADISSGKTSYFNNL